MKVVFCGTPEFAVPTLKHLLAQADLQVAAVVTQPDRPSGRGMKLKFSPVKETALAASVTVYQPEKIRAAESRAFLQQAAPDAIVIIAYGQIIPAALLPIPRFGWINLHGSLLPKYRGAAPIQWAIAHGETRTGLTTMRIDAGMDTGDMLLVAETPIAPTETTPQLAARLAQMGAPLMADTLRGLRAGTLASRPQRNENASYAPLLKKEHGRIDWGRSAAEVYNRMRAFTPWPGAFTTFRGQTCQIIGEPVSKQEGAAIPGAGGSPNAAPAPGTVRVLGSDMLAACGGATELRLTSVKLAGGQAMQASDFARRMQVTEGERFDQT